MLDDFLQVEHDPDVFLRLLVLADANLGNPGVVDHLLFQRADLVVRPGDVDDQALPLDEEVFVLERAVALQSDNQAVGLLLHVDRREGARAGRDDDLRCRGFGCGCRGRGRLDGNGGDNRRRRRNSRLGAHRGGSGCDDRSRGLLGRNIQDDAVPRPSTS